MDSYVKRLNDADFCSQICIIMEIPSVLLFHFVFILPFYLIKKGIHFSIRGVFLLFCVLYYLLSPSNGEDCQPAESLPGNEKLKSAKLDTPIRRSKKSQRSKISSPTKHSNEISTHVSEGAIKSDVGAKMEIDEQNDKISDDIPNDSGLTMISEDSSDFEIQNDIEDESYDDVIREEVRNSEYSPSQILEDYSVNILNDFEFGRFLGEGSFGSMRECKHINSQQKFACKILPKKKNFAEVVARELSMMMNLKGHANIVNFGGFYEDQVNYYLVMEYCDGGSLRDLLCQRRLTEEEAKCIFKQLVSAVGFCHSKRVVHRDLKPDNILICRSPEADGSVQIKLSDFGFSKVLRSGATHMQGRAGTILYAAPETIESTVYGYSSDLFSMGCILYEMLYGTFAFYGETMEEIEESIMDGTVDYIDENSNMDISNEAYLMLHELLVEEEFRGSMDDILIHPYMA